MRAVLHARQRAAMRCSERPGARIFEIVPGKPVVDAVRVIRHKDGSFVLEIEEKI